MLPQGTQKLLGQLQQKVLSCHYSLSDPFFPPSSCSFIPIFVNQVPHKRLKSFSAMILLCSCNTGTVFFFTLLLHLVWVISCRSAHEMEAQLIPLYWESTVSQSAARQTLSQITCCLVSQPIRLLTALSDIHLWFCSSLWRTAIETQSGLQVICEEEVRQVMLASVATAHTSSHRWKKETSCHLFRTGSFGTVK